MSDFPALHTGPMTHHSVGGDDSYQVVQGSSPDFLPADLLPPSWFITVNPNGEADAAETDFDLNTCFPSYNQDASFVQLKDVNFDELRQALYDQAKTEAGDHVECFNGGLYALWQMPNGDVMLGGFDNGGSDIAQYAIEEIGRKFPAHMVGEGRDAHFDTEKLLDPANAADLDEEEKALAELIGPLGSTPPPQLIPCFTRPR